jgi:hypothetical protein
VKIAQDASPISVNLRVAFVIILFYALLNEIRGEQGAGV